MLKLFKPIKYQGSLKFIAFLFFLLSTTIIIAQQNEQIIGHWALDKIVTKKATYTCLASTKEHLVDLFKARLISTQDKEKQLMPEELDIITTRAEELANIHFQSNIEFQPNGAFYITSENTLSGEYLLDGKKLLMEWETADKNTYKILKMTASELILKDEDLKVVYYYTKVE